GPATPRPAAGAAAGMPAGWTRAADTAVARAPRAMVVTDAPLATAVGVDVLRAGGNAVDAAVATAFALAVVYPEAGNIGGGGFMVTRLADGTTAALDFREAAPLAATRDMYLDERGEPTDRSITGHLASGVPGSVAGLWEAHQRFGSKPWAELLAPAIRLAREGFIVDEHFSAAIRVDSARLSRFPASAALLLPGGRRPSPRAHPRRPRPAPALPRRGRAAPAGRPPAGAREPVAQPRPRRDPRAHRGARAGRLLRGRDGGPHRGGDAARWGNHHP